MIQIAQKAYRSADSWQRNGLAANLGCPEVSNRLSSANSWALLEMFIFSGASLMKLGKMMIMPLLAVTLAGCVLDASRDKAQQPTVGQQLRDLKAAHDEGAISDEEYQKAKSKLVDNLQ